MKHFHANLLTLIYEKKDDGLWPLPLTLGDTMNGIELLVKDLESWLCYIAVKVCSCM